MKSSVNGDKKEEKVGAEVVTTEENSTNQELLGIVKDLQRKIAKIEENKVTDLGTEGKKETIAADDFLEVPAIFFSYSTSYVINGDKRRNKVVKAPGEEMVKFRKAYRYERRSASKRGVDIVSTCSVSVQSKALAEWLRGHTLFGIKFFENMSEATNVDVSFAEKMSQVQGVIASMSDMQVIERAKEFEGIKIDTPDTDFIRRQLVEKLARKQMNGESIEKVERYVNGQGKQNKTIDENAIKKGNVAPSPY